MNLSECFGLRYLDTCFGLKPLGCKMAMPHLATGRRSWPLAFRAAQLSSQPGGQHDLGSLVASSKLFPPHT